MEHGNIGFIYVHAVKFEWGGKGGPDTAHPLYETLYIGLWQLTLPGKEEDDSTVAGGGVQEAHGPGAVVVRHHYVYARTGLADVAGLGVVHLAYAVCEWAYAERERERERDVCVCVTILCVKSE